VGTTICQFVSPFQAQIDSKGMATVGAIIFLFRALAYQLEVCIKRTISDFIYRSYCVDLLCQLLYYYGGKGCQFGGLEFHMVYVLF